MIDAGSKLIAVSRKKQNITYKKFIAGYMMPTPYPLPYTNYIGYRAAKYGRE